LLIMLFVFERVKATYREARGKRSTRAEVSKHLVIKGFLPQSPDLCWPGPLGLRAQSGIIDVSLALPKNLALKNLASKGAFASLIGLSAPSDAENPVMFLGPTMRPTLVAASAIWDVEGQLISTQEKLPLSLEVLAIFACGNETGLTNFLCRRSVAFLGAAVSTAKLDGLVFPSLKRRGNQTRLHDASHILRKPLPTKPGSFHHVSWNWQSFLKTNHAD